MAEPSIQLIKIKSRGSGEEAELTVQISSGEHSEIRSFTVSAKMLSDLGMNLLPALPCPLSMRQVDILEYDSRLWEAIRKGLDLLAYGDNTRRALADKLRARGFTPDIAEDAAQWLADTGVINEREQCMRLIKSLSGVKGYGPARIRQELLHKGIARDILDECMEELWDEIDFDAILHRHVEKSFDFSRMNDRKYKESFLSSLHRKGFSPSDTLAVIREMRED